MKLNNCKHCDTLIDSKKMGSHVLTCSKNPKFAGYNLKRKETLNTKTIKNKSYVKNFDVVCNKCSKEFIISEDERKYPIKEKYFCSISCSNSRECSLETKRKIADTLYKGPKTVDADGAIIKVKYSKLCKKCYCEFTPIFNAVYCSRKCQSENISQETRLKISKSNKGKTGGWRNFGGNGKKGKYKSLVYQSSWELAWLIYQFEHGFKPERVKDFILYEKSAGKFARYYPDFILDGKVFEIKGYWSAITEAKLTAAKEVNIEITLIAKNEIIPFLQYCKNKYGEKFWSNPKVFE